MSKKLVAMGMVLLLAGVALAALPENKDGAQTPCAKSCAGQCPATATAAVGTSCGTACAVQTAKAGTQACQTKCASQCAKQCAEQCAKQCSESAAKSCTADCAKQCADATAKTCTTQCAKDCPLAGKDCPLAGKDCPLATKACQQSCSAACSKDCSQQCAKECTKACAQGAECTKQCAKECSETECKALCPVSGKAADKSVAVDYKGGKLFMCCAGCPGAFEKNQAKFAAKANHQMVVTGQAVQVGCPLTSGKVNPDTAIEVGGVKIGFCCNGCKGKATKAEGDGQVALLFGDKAFKQAFKVKTEKDAEKDTE
jgi:hypothetical protein